MSIFDIFDQNAGIVSNLGRTRPTPSSNDPLQLMLYFWPNSLDRASPPNWIGHRFKCRNYELNTSSSIHLRYFVYFRFSRSLQLCTCGRTSRTNPMCSGGLHSYAVPQSAHAVWQTPPQTTVSETDSPRNCRRAFLSIYWIGKYGGKRS